MIHLDSMQWFAAGPFIAIACGVLLLMVLDLTGILFSEVHRTSLALMTLLVSLMFVRMYPLLGEQYFFGQVTADSFADLFSTLMIISAGAVILMNHGTLEAQKVERTRDFNLLVLLSTAGGIGMVCSNSLLSLFLSLELLSIPLYVLVCTARGERASTEGGLKYFLLGALASCFFLYGMALIYVLTGTLEISVLSRALQGNIVLHPLLLTAVGLLLFGFAFKLSLAPFHFWAPDAYQGAPISVLGFMAVVVKIAAFGALVRVFSVAFGSFESLWSGFIIVLAGLSMLAGNLAALRQRSIKRIIAYSSIAQAGYTVVALPFAATGGLEALMVNVLVYSITSLGLAAVLIGQLGGTAKQYSGDAVESLRGMYQRDPLAALALAIFVLSLAGIPPLGGFYGKFLIINAALKGDSPGVAIFLVVNSAISLFYYLKLIAVAFERTEGSEARAFPLVPLRVVTLTSALVILLATLFIDPATGAAGDAVRGLIVPLAPRI